MRAMGEDGYVVCPFYRYNPQLRCYELSSLAPAHVREVSYFRHSQMRHYVEDLGGCGKRSQSIIGGPDYRLRILAASVAPDTDDDEEDGWEDLDMRCSKRWNTDEVHSARNKMLSMGKSLFAVCD